jgi:hypothetical protein
MPKLAVSRLRLDLDSQTRRQTRIVNCFERENRNSNVENLDGGDVRENVGNLDGWAHSGYLPPQGNRGKTPDNNV